MDNFLDTLAQKYNAQEMINANAQAEANEMRHLQEQVEAYEAVLQEMRKLNYRNTELTEKMYSLVDESIEKVRTLQIEASTSGANTEQISREMSEAVNNALTEAINNLDSSVAQSLSNSLADVLKVSSDAIRSSADDIMMAADDLRESNKAVKSQTDENRVMCEKLQATMTEVIDNSRILMASIDELKALQAKNEETDYLDDETEFEETEESGKETMPSEEMQAITEASDAIRAALSILQLSGESANASLESLRQDTDNVQNQLRSLLESVETIQISMQNAEDVQTQPQQSEEIEEMRNQMNELVAGLEELRTGMRNTKMATDDVKTSLKTAVDSGFYSVKQENKDLADKFQKLNADILAKMGDNDEEQKKQEEQERLEEQKRDFEERIKATEDFMHKESVKVYRNVQAVINEKLEQQNADNETKLKQVTIKANQAKTAAIIASVIAAAGVVIQVLQIFKII
ncbi:MAG: hypothetical protein ACI4DU_08030 [Lachnospiraceae bacterium]